VEQNRGGGDCREVLRCQIVLDLHVSVVLEVGDRQARNTADPLASRR
jgi:hypothetical protein